MSTLENVGSFDDGEAVSYVGTRNVWGGEEQFGLEAADRRHHLYCIGKTGTGKTTLLRNLILQDIYAGAGVGVIDPHGDLCHDLLDHIPPSRTDDVVFFNPADLEHPVGFNLLQNVPPERRHRIASGTRLAIVRERQVQAERVAAERREQDVRGRQSPQDAERRRDGGTVRTESVEQRDREARERDEAQRREAEARQQAASRNQTHGSRSRSARRR